MGALLVGLSAVLANEPVWRTYTPSLPGRKVGRSVDDPEALLAVFVLALAVVGGATLFVLGGGDVFVVLGALGLTVIAFVAGGVYLMGRSHGHPHSHAVAEAVLVIGAFGLVAVAGWLIAAPWQ
jgi:hypothetical protein